MRMLPIQKLTTFHLWRVPAALVFFHYGAQALLPDAFRSRVHDRAPRRSRDAGQTERHVKP